MQTKVFDIEVKTKDKIWAGTDNTVQISMSGPVSGSTKNTGMITLDKKGVNDHERGDLCTFEIGDSIPNRFQFALIENLTVLKHGSDDWNLEWIKEIISNHFRSRISRTDRVATTAHRSLFRTVRLNKILDKI